MKLLTGVSLAVLPAAAWSAQFIPETGGYLDSDENWTENRAVCAVAKAQSGPLSISENGATLPGAAGTLNYWNFAYTNDFGAGMVLNLNSKALTIDRGAALRQISGGINAGNASSVTGTTLPAKFVIAGAGSSFSGYQMYVDALGSTVLANSLEVLDGGNIALTGGFIVSGGRNAARVVISGAGTAVSSSTSLLIGAAAAHNSSAVADVPGVSRVVRIENGASASFTTGVSVGQQSGGCKLQIGSGATLSTGTLTVADSAPNAGGGPTNNEVNVSAAQIVMTGDCVVGADPSAADNAITVADAGSIHASGALIVGKNGTRNVLHVSGAGSSAVVNGKAFVGGRAGASGEGIPVCNAVRVENGASLRIGDDVHVGMVGGFGNSLHISAGAAFSAKSISLYAGNSIAVSDASLELTNGITMTTSASTGSVAAFTNATVVLGKERYAAVGGNASLLSFSRCEVSVPRRWSIQGRDFTMRIDDSRLEYTDPSDWFITGGTGSEGTDQKRTFVFEGANPHLKIHGSKGMFLRGGVDIVFNLGRDGFPKDHAVIDLVDSSAQFSGNDLAAHRVAVNVSDRCPPGLYTIMKGRNCGTFLTAADAYTVSPSCHKLVRTTENGVDVLKVSVRNPGLMLVYK